MHGRVISMPCRMLAVKKIEPDYLTVDQRISLYCGMPYRPHHAITIWLWTSVSENSAYHNGKPGIASRPYW